MLVSDRTMVVVPSRTVQGYQVLLGWVAVCDVNKLQMWL